MAFDTFLVKFQVLICYLTLPLISSDILYTSDDVVLIHDSKTFETDTFLQREASLVEFYNSWCGHCIRFAPIWKQFALSVDGWKPLVKIGVLDCSEEINVAICEKYDITAYPTIKFFPPDSQIGFSGTVFDKAHQNTSDLENGLIDLLQDHSETFTEYDVQSLLSPIRHLEDAWSNAPSTTQYTVVVFEEKDSYLGRKVILDAVIYKEVHVARVYRENLQGLTDLTIPSLNLMEKDGTFKLLIGSESEHALYKRAICDLIGVILDTEGGAGDYSLDEAPPALPHQHGGLVHMQDLESTLQHMLRQEIATCKTIGGEKLDALKTFMSVLAKYFPGQTPIKQYLWSINSWVKSRSDMLTGSEWLTSINSLETEQAWLPNYQNWTGCHRSIKYMGYPCGVWTLFHTLTVSAYNNDDDDAEPKEVLMGMKAFIIHFFGCSECSTNFQKEIRELEERVHSTKEAVIYLWEVHNSVNKRLHGDLTEDPVHPKVQFPTNQTCADCHVVSPDDSIGWDKEGVFKFLLKIYSRVNIVQDSKILKPYISYLRDIKDEKRKQDIKEFSLQKVEKKKKSVDNMFQAIDFKPAQDKIQNIIDLRENERKSRKFDAEPHVSYLGLNGFDISICITFYVFCSLIIIYVYFKILHRRRRVVKSVV